MLRRVLSFIFMASLASFAATAATCHKPAADLQEKVRHEMVMLPYLGVFDHLAYSVDGSEVTLVGKVTNPTLKKDAERAVLRIEGVERVDNRIDVLPPSPHDDGLRIKVYRAIYGFAPLQRYALVPLKPIRIVVDRGHVTLEGIVDSDADRNMANLRANGVPGVFSVSNNLAVAANASKS